MSRVIAEYHLSDPADNCASVTASDSTTFEASYIRVGTTAGDVAVVTVGGQTVTIPSVQVGEVLPVRVTKVKSTGTTAAGITRFY